MPDMVSAFRNAMTSAPKGKKVVAIHLFGIRYANALEGLDLKRLAVLAGESASYGTELYKGMRLAPFVTIISDPQ